MADKRTYSDEMREELVREIIEANDGNVPSEMRERYVGPKEASISSSRGAIWGAVGAVTGFFLGRTTGANQRNDPIAFKGKNQRVFAFAGGFIGATLGLFSGSNEAREGARQVRRMQRRIEDMYNQNLVLKDEVLAQQTSVADEMPNAEDVTEPKPSVKEVADDMPAPSEDAQETTPAEEPAEEEMLSEDTRDEPETPDTHIAGETVAEHEVSHEEERAVS